MEGKTRPLPALPQQKGVAWGRGLKGVLARPCLGGKSNEAGMLKALPKSCPSFRWVDPRRRCENRAGLKSGARPPVIPGISEKEGASSCSGVLRIEGRAEGAWYIG